MKMYKGFDKDMKCRGYQFEVGKTYEEPEAKLCARGFHACEHPLDVFRYYAPGGSRFAEVDLGGLAKERDSDTKRAGKCITITAELKLHEIISAAVKFVFERVYVLEMPVQKTICRIYAEFGKVFEYHEKLPHDNHCEYYSDRCSEFFAYVYYFCQKSDFSGRHFNRHLLSIYN